MTDELYRAEQEIEMELAEALRKRYEPGPRPNGLCHYCGELLTQQLRWCNVDCEREWERMRERRRTNQC